MTSEGIVKIFQTERGAELTWKKSEKNREIIEKDHF